MGRFAGGGETKRKVAPHKLFQHGVQELVHMTRFLISAAVGAIDVVATVMRRPHQSATAYRHNKEIGEVST